MNTITKAFTGRFRKDYPAILALFTHLSLFCTLYLVSYFFVTGINLPDNDNLLNWDAAWYYQIKEIGYYYVKGHQNNLVFFPLFSFIWKALMIDQEGISIVNFLLYSLSFYLLAKQLSLNYVTSLVFLSTPSLFFCYLPYSESLFFFASTLVLIGVESNKCNYWLTGIIIASLTRAVNVVFAPALIFTYIAVYGYKKQTFKLLLVQILLIFVTGLFVLYLQYYYTGQWAVMFKVQKFWFRSLQLPTLPLTTLTGAKKLWLDGIALFVGILAFYDTLIVVKECLIKQKPVAWPPAALLSMAYLSIVGVISVFYSGIWPGQDGTSIMSLNRYIFSTPFFIFYIYHKCSNRQGRRIWDEVAIVLGLTIFCLGGYKRLNELGSFDATIIYFGIIVCYIVAYLIALKYKRCMIVLYGINLVIQIVLFNGFLSNSWVG